LVVWTQHASAQSARTPPASKQLDQLTERDKLVKQIDELRQAGKFDEAVPVAERLLVLERRAGNGTTAGVADALSRLASLGELRGDWPGAIARRKEALSVRERTEGRDHWRTANARIALAVAAKVAGLGEPNRTKVTAALHKEQEAVRLISERKYAQAERMALEVLETYRAVVGAESPEAARIWHVIGRARLLRNDATAAKEANEQAVAIRRKALPQYHPLIADSLNDLGNAQSSLREYAAAKAIYEEALAIRRKVLPKEHPDIASSLNNLGILHVHLFEYTAAKATFEKALAIRRNVLPKNHADIARVAYNLGCMQAALRELAAAKASFEEASAIFRKALPKDNPEIARSLNNLGAAQHELREYAAAKASHEEALTIFRKALPKDHLAIARSLNALGDMKLHLREYAASQATLNEALAILRRALPKDDSDIARCLSYLGNVQLELREYAAAKASFEEASAIRRKVLPKDHPDIASSLNGLGLVQREVGEYAAALASLEEALAIRRKVLPKDDPDIADSLNNLGTVQCELREYAAAKASFEDALAIQRKARPNDNPRIGLGLNNLGAVQYQLHEYAAGTASAAEALAICRKGLPKDHPHIAVALGNFGLLSLVSGVDVASARVTLLEATDIFQADQLHLAVAQAEPEQLATAEESHKALSLLLTAAINSKAGLGPTYDRVVGVKGSVTAQQRWVRHARDAADPDTVRMLDRLRHLTQQIVGLSLVERSTERLSDVHDEPALLQQLSEERARLEQQLSARSAPFRTMQSRARVGFDQIRAALPNGTALVDLVAYAHLQAPAKLPAEPALEERVVAFVARPEQSKVHVVSLGATQTLADLIDGWRSSHGTGKRPAAGAADRGVELRKRLWEPLEEHLRGVRVVLVSPDGPLNGLPWAALPGAKPGTFLIHEYAFAVVPTPQLLPELFRAGTGREAEPASVVVGNIDFDALPAGAAAITRVNQFARLPGTVAEATAVHDLFRAQFAGRPADLLLGKEATKEEFVKRASNCSHLLVATHGFFLPEPKQTQRSATQGTRSPESLLFHSDPVKTNPALRSGLVFAGANFATLGKGNSFLTALEASDLGLGKVDLAVLSACETGLGKIEGGEGVLGLQRAFQLAGARTTVTSLWKVPDATTQALMTRFHRNLWQKKMTKLEALREAQIWMIQEGRKHPELGLRGGLERPDPKSHERDAVSPFYWAAFVLSGDWR
jgi:CHAT domain-containing protein/tetratricopeptide (TPR) repeat protein